MYRPVLRLKPWYHTELAQAYATGGLATRLVARAIAYVGWPQPDNDRDFWRW